MNKHDDPAMRDHYATLERMEQQRIMTEAIAKGTEEGIKRTWTVEQKAEYNAQNGVAGFYGIILMGIYGACYYGWHRVSEFWCAYMPNPTVYKDFTLDWVVAWGAVLLFLRLVYLGVCAIMRWTAWK